MCLTPRVQVRTRARHFVLGAGAPVDPRERCGDLLRIWRKMPLLLCFPEASLSLFLQPPIPASFSLSAPRSSLVLIPLFSPFLRPSPPRCFPNSPKHTLQPADGVREAGIQILSLPERGGFPAETSPSHVPREKSWRGVPSRGGSPKCLQAPSALTPV